MKTTVEIDDELLKAAKRAAIDEGVTLRQLIEEGLRHRMALSASASRLRIWGTQENTSREDLYASESWGILEDVERAFAEAKRRRAHT